MDDEIKNADELAINFFEAYLRRRDLALAETYLLDNVQWSGVRENEAFRGKAAVFAMLAKKEPLCAASWQKIAGQRLADDCALAIFEVAARRAGAPRREMFSIRAALVCRRVEERYGIEAMYLCMNRDFIAQAQYRRKLLGEIREKEQQVRRYDHLFQSVLCGIVQYAYSPENRSLRFKRVNREALRITGYVEEEVWRRRWVMEDFVAPEDRDAMYVMFGGLRKIGDRGEYQYRILGKDGQRRWVIGSAELIRDADGDLVIQSVFLDIDDRKRAEQSNQELARQVEVGNRLLRIALAHTSAYEFYYYPETRRVVVPERTRAYYQSEAQYEHMPESTVEGFATADREEYIRMYERIHAGERTATAEVFGWRHSKWCRITLSVISWNEAQQPSLVVGIVEDITREKEAALALEERTARDPLTGLWLKKAGVDRIRAHLLRKEPAQVCALMLLDLDDFARVNAQAGRVFADAVLQDVAAILREETGSDDVQIRLGGDEFMLFVKDCDKRRATELGPRIARRVKALYAEAEQESAVSVSIGMCVTAVVEEYSSLYRCAESSLLYVKEHCRGSAACYLDTSNALGIDLTQLYTNRYAFDEIETKQSVYGENLVDFALELLGQAKDLDGAIHLLLARIGNRCRLDRVSISDVSEEYLSFRYVYQWARDRADMQLGKTFYFSRAEYDRMSRFYDREGICDRPVYVSASMPSCLQAAMWNQGRYAGSLRFELRAADACWPDEQRRMIKEMAKLIASFVMKARSDAVSRAKSEFLSRMSHEIRTPMNAIAGMTMIAKNTLDDKEQALECLNKIESANGYLLRLINDILDMSRIESGKLELSCESVCLRTLLDKLENMLRPQAAEKELALRFSCAFDPQRPLWLDVLRLTQVLVNIIGNAVKFTEPHGRIDVRIVPQDEGEGSVALRFSVLDTGVGIEAEAIDSIFQVFEQAGPHTAARYGGTGLGLAISSRLVQLMGGQLEVRSELGRGSEFFFTITVPFAAAEAAKPEPAPPPPGAAETRRRILVVEDNELNLEIAVAILEMHGFYTEVAMDGAAAVELFGKRPDGYYDAILMDIRMPVLDGLEATRRIRTSRKGCARTIPIIALTANAFDEDAKASLASGMNGHLSKPIDVGQLLDTLRRCLAQQEPG